MTTSATDKYFSINGGASAFEGKASFAKGTFNGDGDQASHWRAPTASPFCSGLVGIMNPYLCDGTGAIITSQDLGAFDAIGWNLNVDVLANPGYAFTTADAYTQYQASLPGVPEPANWALLSGGFGFIDEAMRRRRTTTMRVTFA